MITTSTRNDPNRWPLLAAYMAGTATILDLAGHLSSPRRRDDAEALAADWAAVGNDLHSVIGSPWIRRLEPPEPSAESVHE